MRQQEVFNKIGGIINELTEQYNYLKTEEIPLNDLELELFAANANFLADHLEVLRKLNANLASKPVAETPKQVETTPEPEAIGTPVFEEPESTFAEENQPEQQVMEEEPAAFEFDFTGNAAEPVEENVEPDASEEYDLAYVDDEEEREEDKPEIQLTATDDQHEPEIDLKPDTGEDHFSFIRSTEPDIIRHEFELSEANTFPEEEPHEETVAEALAEQYHEQPVVEEPGPIVKIEELKEEAPITQQEEKPLTLNERIAAQTGHLQAKPEAPRITDLKSAITLNDKMLFVRDLFNGYSLAYSEAIEILNRFSKLEDAERFLHVNYEEKNHWHDKYATRQKFYELLRRRFD